MTRPIIRVGSANASVVEWQRAIGITADGIFGKQTEKATKVWQAARGLVADGIVGPITWAALDKEIGPRPVLPPIIRGTDVSAIQGELNDDVWKAMADQGIKFAYMRLAVGNETWIDRTAKRNAQRAKTHSVVPGYYVFPYPLPHLDPKKQIERFVQLIDGMGMNPGELPPMFDLEWPPPEDWPRWKCSPEQLQEWGLVALERAEELTGLKWAVYTYRWWAKMAQLIKAPLYAKYPLVIADYKYSGKWPTPEEVDLLPTIAPWPKAQIMAIQHDGNGGMKLPNGRDADFQVMPGGMAALVKHTRGRVVECSPDLGLLAARPLITESDTFGAIKDAEIATYRAKRIDIPG